VSWGVFLVPLLAMLLFGMMVIMTIRNWQQLCSVHDPLAGTAAVHSHLFFSAHDRLVHENGRL